VRVTASGTLAPDRSAFEAIGRGDVYGLDGELIATNHTAIRGRRADRQAQRVTDSDRQADGDASEKTLSRS